METKHCKKCSSIYPEDVARCPSCGRRCGKKRTQSQGTAGNRAALKAEQGAVLPAESAAVSARLVEVKERKYTLSEILKISAKGAVGCLIGGIPGFAVGVATAKQKTKTAEMSAMFIVNYADGHQGTETVDTNSPRFQELMLVVKK